MRHPLIKQAARLAGATRPLGAVRMRALGLICAVGAAALLAEEAGLAGADKFTNEEKLEIKAEVE